MKILILILISLSIMSCESFLDDEVFTTVTVENFYKNESEVRAGLTSAYSKFQVPEYYDNVIFQIADASTDMVITRFSNSYNNFSVEKDHDNYEPFWESSWVANNAINYVITYSAKADMDDDIRAQLVAEARFLRALNYFNLVRVYGQVPLVLEPVVTVEDNLYPKTVSRDFIYDQIIEDLKYAEEILPKANNAHATQGAAKALLAKVYLTYAGYHKSDDNVETIEKGDPQYYALAAEKLEQVINGGYGYDLFNDYADVFANTSENGVENIFSIQYKQGVMGAGATGGEGSLKQTHWAPQNFGITFAAYETYRSPASFYKKFADNDKRRPVTFADQFVDENDVLRQFKTDGTGNLPTAYTFVRKYLRDIKEGSGGNFTMASAKDGEENTIVLRYADVLLMQTEALYFLNGAVNTEVLSGINKVRARAGLTNILPADLANETDFVNALLNERERELCFEGHGWFDYVRLGQLNERAVKSQKTLNKFYYWPIPALEVRKNTNLLQSPGW